MRVRRGDLPRRFWVGAVLPLLLALFAATAMTAMHIRYVFFDLIAAMFSDKINALRARVAICHDGLAVLIGYGKITRANDVHSDEHVCTG